MYSRSKRGSITQHFLDLWGNRDRRLYFAIKGSCDHRIRVFQHRYISGSFGHCCAVVSQDTVSRRLCAKSHQGRRRDHLRTTQRVPQAITKRWRCRVWCTTNTEISAGIEIQTIRKK